MEISYWQSRWNKDKTGWHMNRVYPLLKEYWPRLNVSSGAAILVPLCGKSLDMQWLAERNYIVTGIEVAEKAVREFIKDYSGDFSRGSRHGFKVFESNKISLWQGDFLKLPADAIGKPDVIYDKAALVAFPPVKRKAYAEKIMALKDNKTQILLQTFEYNQQEMSGPPFAVFRDEVHTLYKEQFDITILHREARYDVFSKFRLRGFESYFNEILYLLTPKCSE